MTLISGRKRRPILELTDLVQKENASLEVEGVEQIRVREEAGNWRTYRVRGRTNLLEACELQGRPGEYEIELDGHRLFVSLGLAHFTQAQVDEMVAALHEQEYCHDARARGGQHARLFTALREDVEAFVVAWRDLREVVQAIVARPAERLTQEVNEVGLQRYQRHTATTLALNLRTGRLTATGEATHEKLYALSDRVSLDTAENSHLVSVVEAYEARRDLLLDRTSRQLRSLNLEFEREQAYQAAPERRERLQDLLQVIQGLREQLQVLKEQPLPDTWRLFRNKPSASTNRARFDERYSRAVNLEERLHAHRIQGRPENALEVLQECGRRATWELYEYWLVAKLCEQLEELGFSCDQEGGFLFLEDWRGAAYGLQENTSLTFHHSGELGIRLTYERLVPWKEKSKACILRPDLVLEFIDLEGGSFPLVLDAKYKNLTPRHRGLPGDLQNSARRYGQALGDAMAFLVHPGDKGNVPWQYWPAHGPKEAPSVAKEEDFPLRHGVIAAAPGGEQDEDVRALRRVLTAWFVKHGIFRVCFRCGDDLAEYHVRETSVRQGRITSIIRIGDRQGQIQNKGYRCPSCGMVAVISFCSACQRQGRHSVTFKHYPHLEEGTDVLRVIAPEAWAEQMEIMQPVAEKERYYVRHCATCGSDYIPGEKRA